LPVGKALHAALLEGFSCASRQSEFWWIKMSINITPSHEGRFHEWAKVANGQEIPMSKIK
jgi:hypothetical protein